MAYKKFIIRNTNIPTWKAKITIPEGYGDMIIKPKEEIPSYYKSVTFTGGSFNSTGSLLYKLVESYIADVAGIDTTNTMGDLDEMLIFNVDYCTCEGVT